MNKIFLTENKENKWLNSPRVYAKNWGEAEKICPKKFVIIGILREEIECEESIANYFSNKMN